MGVNNSIRNLANSLDVDQFRGMIDNESPEREVEHLSGIQFKLPIENRKRRKIKRKRAPVSTLTLEDYCEELDNGETDYESMMSFFEKFPKLKEAYYRGYNQLVVDN